MNVFICTDGLFLRKRIEEIVESYASMPNINITLNLSAASPQGLLRYLDIHPAKRALYILDADIISEVDCLVFASKIRDSDTKGKIVILSAQTELHESIFEHAIEALDYIVKGDLEFLTVQIKRCIETAYQRFVSVGDHAQA